MNKIKYIGVVLIALAGLGLQQAKADTFTSSLNAGNPAIAGFTGPYGTVTIVTNGTNTATVTFTSGSTASNVYLFGDGGSVALNVSVSTFTVNSIVGTNSAAGFTPGAFTQTAAGNEDGFGSFNLRINDFDGYTHTADSITFNLVNTSGAWGSAASVLAFNAQGFDAAAHIFVSATNPANAATSALATGFAAEGAGTITVPDGGTTVMLLGVALGALGMARRFLMS
jgi:hypothetical protein